MSYQLPTIPDDKIHFYREMLLREVANMFEWQGLPDEIPLDYLEYTLVTEGKAMFFNEPSTFGYMVLSCGVRGFNVYNRPVTAYAVAPNTEGMSTTYERTIMYKYTPELDPVNGCVLINNIHQGQPIIDIVDFYAYRMALVQMAFDTNALWQNTPVVFSVPDSTTKLSLEKMFADIYTGKPWLVVDQLLLAGEKPVMPSVVPVEFKLDKLQDTLNELKAKFHEAIGINTPGADKKERLLEDEVNANNQALETTLQIMLSQRQRACEEISNLFPELSPSVKVKAQEVADSGTDNDGTSARSGDGGLPVI